MNKRTLSHLEDMVGRTISAVTETEEGCSQRVHIFFTDGDSIIIESSGISPSGDSELLVVVEDTPKDPTNQ